MAFANWTSGSFDISVNSVKFTVTDSSWGFMLFDSTEKKDMDNIKQAWEGLASLNFIYMIIALFPPMAPNATLEEALYSMFFPPGGEFDKVLEKSKTYYHSGI